MDTKVSLKKITLKSPIVLLSGTVSMKILEFQDPEKIGLVVLKTVTAEPKEPNPEPRMWDLQVGVLNSIGLYNRGWEYFFEKELPEYLKTGFEFGVSLAEFTQESFHSLIKKAAASLNEIEAVKAVELNFSCPNVKKGGIAFASQPDTIKELTGLAAENFSREIWVKISPAFDVRTQVEAAIAGGATAVVVANTYPATALRSDGSAVLGAGSGGLSGRALHPINLLNVLSVASQEKCIIASGGVDSFDAGLQYLCAGARAFGVGTALFRNPLITSEIYDDMVKAIKNAGAASLNEFLNKIKAKGAR